MRLKKFMAVGLAAVMSAAVLSGCGGSDKKDEAKKEQKKIGVVQLTEHAALDAAYITVTKALKKALRMPDIKTEIRSRLNIRMLRMSSQIVRPSHLSLSMTSVIWFWRLPHLRLRRWRMSQRIFRFW